MITLFGCVPYARLLLAQFSARINKIDGLFKSLSGLLPQSCSNPLALYGPVNGEATGLEIPLFGEKEENDRIYGRG